MKRAPLLIANWKSRPDRAGEAIILARETVLWRSVHASAPVDIVLCPPDVFMNDVSDTLGDVSVSLGAQDFTENISNSVKYVIVGHSSKRQNGESDEVVHQKLLSALNKEIIPILCVSTIKQVKSAFVGLDAPDLKRVVVAYEPEWAISTSPGGHPDTPESANMVISHIKEIIPITCLYGGSVDASNASAFLSMPEISGLLIGAASVRPGVFVKILDSAT